MATQNFSEPETDLVSWAGIAAGDDGLPYLVPPDRKMMSVQVEGINGHTVTFQGSNDGSTYYTLADLTDTAISLTADGLVSLQTAAKWVRPAAVSGTGTVTVTLHFAS